MRVLFLLAFFISLSSTAVDMRIYFCENDDMDLLFQQNFTKEKVEATLYLSLDSSEFCCTVNEHKEDDHKISVSAHENELGTLSFSLAMPNTLGPTQIHKGRTEYLPKSESLLAITDGQGITTYQSMVCAVQDIDDEVEFYNSIITNLTFP